ncbi:hypothetical protein LBMAG42_14810 [Deltaproteobacteria bacterium]|nr:hypothetical protein LBMAG42_14810 [Deltaproteobacteria bacterium]
MIHLFLGVPLVTAGGFSAYSYDPNYNERGETMYQLGGAAFVDGPALRLSEFDLRVFGGVNHETMRYEAPGLDFDGTTWTGELEIGPRWRFGVGFVEFGLGAHARLGLPDLADAALVMGLGSHSMLGVELGEGKLHTLLGLRFGWTFSSSYASGNILQGDDTLSWDWSAPSGRALACVGLGFGG